MDLGPHCDYRYRTAMDIFDPHRVPVDVADVTPVEVPAPRDVTPVPVSTDGTATA